MQQERRRSHLAKRWGFADAARMACAYRHVYRHKGGGLGWYILHTQTSGIAKTTGVFYTQLEALLTIQMRTGAPLMIDIKEHRIVFPETVKVNNGSAVSMREVLRFLHTNPEYEAHARIYERQVAAIPEGARRVVVPELVE